MEGEAHEEGGCFGGGEGEEALVGAAEGGAGGGVFVGGGRGGGWRWRVVGWGEVFDAPEVDGGCCGGFGEDEVGVEGDAFARDQ